MTTDNPFPRGCAWIQGDNRQLGDGTPGPITTQLRQAYWDAHDDPRWATPLDY